eukprot:Selendium_serpulae@DN4436_c0_g1_i2.p1
MDERPRRPSAEQSVFEFRGPLRPARRRGEPLPNEAPLGGREAPRLGGGGARDVRGDGPRRRTDGEPRDKENLPQAAQERPPSEAAPRGERQIDALPHNAAETHKAAGQADGVAGSGGGGHSAARQRAEANRHQGRSTSTSSSARGGYIQYEELLTTGAARLVRGRRRRTLEFVALKEEPKGAAACALRELDLALSLPRHHCVARLQEVWSTANHVWTAYEYCPGGDVESMLEHDGQALRCRGAEGAACLRTLGAAVAAGLMHLHANAIIHGDLRGSRVLITERRVKLHNLRRAWRLAEVLEAWQDNQPLSAPEVLDYAAPELRGRRPVALRSPTARRRDKGKASPKVDAEHSCAPLYSFQSDLFALGCLLHRLWFGKPPAPKFASGSEAKASLQPRATFFASPLSVPLFRAAIWSACQSGWSRSKSEARRPRSAVLSRRLSRRSFAKPPKSRRCSRTSLWACCSSSPQIASTGVKSHRTRGGAAGLTRR